MPHRVDMAMTRRVPTAHHAPWRKEVDKEARRPGFLPSRASTGLLSGTMVEGPSRAFEPGTIIAGKYKVEGILAAGGQATVAKAMHLRLNRPVAIKFPHDGEPIAEITTELFIREARATFQLRSEHIARVIDVDVEAKAPFIVMEYLEGCDLKQLLARRGALPFQEAIGLMLQAIDGLAEAHDAGIVHRDLKPSNLFVLQRADGTPCLKVLDFGISKGGAFSSSEGDFGDLTVPLKMLGTPRYMAPEQAVDARQATAATDVWALGLILQEMLTGTPVFRARGEADAVARLLSKEPVPISLVRPDVPAEVERLLLRCLQKAPEHRFSDIRELAEALAPFAPAWAAVNVERLRRSSRPGHPARRAKTELPPVAAEGGGRSWGGSMVTALAMACLAAGLSFVGLKWREGQRRHGQVSVAGDAPAFRVGLSRPVVESLPSSARLAPSAGPIDFALSPAPETLGLSGTQATTEGGDLAATRTESLRARSASGSTGVGAVAHAGPAHRASRGASAIHRAHAQRRAPAKMVAANLAASSGAAEAHPETAPLAGGLQTAPTIPPALSAREPDHPLDDRK